MGIAFNCSCGKRISVSDVLAGRTINCPNCHNGVVVPASSPPVPGKAAGKKPVVEKEVETVIHISMGKVLAAVALFVVVVCGVMIAIGPLHVWYAWEDIGPKASDLISDVMTFALDTPPEPVQFFRPVAVMQMPEFVPFHGASNMGLFEGKYDTITGEIEADVHPVYINPHTKKLQPVLDPVTKQPITIHIDGREIDGKPEAEIGSDPDKMMEVTHTRNVKSVTTPLLY